MLAWKPAAALPHFDEPTPILVAYPRAGSHPDDAVPVLAGLYIAHGLTVESEDSDAPPARSDWQWVTEDEALDGAFAAVALEEVDEIPAALYASAMAFAGDDGGSCAHDDNDAGPALVHVLAKAPVSCGVVELVEVVGVRIEHGLVLGPRLSRVGRDWQPDPGGVAIYDEASGDTLAGGRDADTARAKLAALIRSVGGDAEFTARLRRPGALTAAAGAVA